MGWKSRELIAYRGNRFYVCFLSCVFMTLLRVTESKHHFERFVFASLSSPLNERFYMIIMIVCVLGFYRGWIHLYSHSRSLARNASNWNICKDNISSVSCFRVRYEYCSSHLLDWVAGFRRRQCIIAYRNDQISFISPIWGFFLSKNINFVIQGSDHRRWAMCCLLCEIFYSFHDLLALAIEGNDIVFTTKCIISW